eukprot:148641-Prymnesium_polylepis.1
MRRQHRDDWQYYRAPFHHVDLDDIVFAQTPPIPSGKPPSKSIPVTLVEFRVPKGLETVKKPPPVLPT